MSDYLSKPMLVPELQAALERGRRAARHPFQLAAPSAKSAIRAGGCSSVLQDSAKKSAE
jgi:hypothetical protein